MLLVRLLIGLALALVPIPAHAGSFDEITVLTRNMYLGADVGPAMKLLPNFSASAQFMWDQVHQTDFSKRAPALANEIESTNPDVVALQEATVWVCTPSILSHKQVVYDFTQQLISALSVQGLDYKVASAQGKQAFNVGFAINPIPGLTMVHDPTTFMPLFGKSDAACGFRIADTLLVKSNLEVINAGTTEYEKSYTIIPTFMTVYRGYSWADIKIRDTPVRFISTHLESLFDSKAIPVSKIQADQLAQDTQSVSMPLVVMGDFNSDPRDPRGTSDVNPGEQPVANDACQQQVDHPTSANAIDSCNAYWTMVNAGFMDSGPDPTNPANFTWGYGALLNGPDPTRAAGMTDRLDYVFTKNFRQPISAAVIGNRFPEGVGIWSCGAQKCAASDHGGVVVKLHLPVSASIDPELPNHKPIPFGFWKAVGVLVVSLFIWRLRRRLIKH